MTINGERVAFEEIPNKTIQGLLSHYKVDRERVVIEINGKIIGKDDDMQRPLESEDVIEIIHYAGGG